MKKSSIVAALTASLMVLLSAAAQETSKHLLPDDPEKALAEVNKAHNALRAPRQWRTNAPNAQELAHFQATVSKTAMEYADKAEEFIRRFPTSDDIGDVRITVVHTLSYAVAAGDRDAERRAREYTARVLADKSIPEDHRASVFLYAGNVTFFKQIGMRLFTEGLAKMDEEFEAASIAEVREALKLFPANAMLYTFLVAHAERAGRKMQKELASEIINSPQAPAGTKTLAQHLLKGTKPYQIGKPLDIKFTALDGREVDLAKLKGKVVLVVFWATDCGPCLGELPTLKKLYEQHHDEGFEIVAISLDSSEKSLRKVIKEKELPWPQHFDGKGWGNEFGVRYGIFSIPTQWLVDRTGNLRILETRFNLEEQVKTLVREPASKTK